MKVRAIIEVDGEQFEAPVNMATDLLKGEVKDWSGEQTQEFNKRVVNAVHEACNEFYYKNKTGRYAKR